MSIIGSELGTIRRWGRDVAAFGNEFALYWAAEYIAIATPEEAQLLRGEFEEGVRNYVLNMQHYFQCMESLDAKVSELSA